MDRADRGSEFVPHVVVLYCGQSLRAGESVAAALERTVGFSARSAMMACSSQVEMSHVLRILEQGADAVEVVACPPAACRSLVGSTRAEKRVHRVREWLEQIHLGADRVGLTQMGEVTAQAVAAAAATRAAAVRALGPNPMREGVGA